MPEDRVPPGPRITDSAGNGDDNSVPPGWDENPTTWPKRIGLAALAFLGLAIALYLALYQIRVIVGVWDPFFDSTEVLDYLGWPDAIPGILAYGGEVGLNLLGDRNRWRTAPWTVIAFGMIIFPGAAVSAVLMMVQPIFVDEWCTLCLASAGLSLLICGWGADEVLATIQHLKRVRDSGGSVRRALWGDGLKHLQPIPLQKREG